MHDLEAFWFLEKPIQPSALKVPAGARATQSRLAEETERLQRQLAYQGVLVDLVGSCAPMQQVFSMIRQVAPSESRRRWSRARAALERNWWRAPFIG